MPTHPIVVIGAGLSGAAAALAIVRSGRKVVVLERDRPASEHGSSHGSARIFRYGYPDPFYTALVQDARRGWDLLQELSGETLITPSGSIDAGNRREPDKLAQVMTSRGIEHEMMDAATAAARWPGISFDGPVLWHPSAGVIDAERSVEAMIRLAEADGAEVRNGFIVARVTPATDGYLIESVDGDVVIGSQVVVAAGGWLPELLTDIGLPADALSHFPQLEVRQEHAIHFPYRDPSQPWPTFIYKADDIEVYGLPGGRDAEFRGQKVAIYNGGKVIPSGSAHDGVTDPAQRDRLISFVERHLPGLVPEPYAETTCLFTNTPDEDFVIDRVGDVTVLSPCSGHGAKFAPVIGDLAARLVAGDATVPTRFRPLQTGVLS